jgi:ATP-binding cassette, subfamily B, bacterial PglK
LKKHFQYLKEISDLLGEERRKLPRIIILFFLVSVLDLAGLGLLGPYINLVINPNSLETGRVQEFLSIMNLPRDQQQLLIYLSLFLVIIFVFKTIFSILVNYFINKFALGQIVRLKSNLMQGYQLMPYEKYLNRNSSDYVHAIQVQTEGFGAVLQWGLKSLCDSLIGLTIFILLAFTNLIALTLLLVLIILMIFGYDILFKIKLKRYGRLANDSSTRVIKNIREGIEGFKEIRILARESYFHNKLHFNAQAFAHNQIKSQIITTAPRYLLELIMIIFVVTITIFTLVMDQDLQSLIPTLGIFGVAAIRLLPSVNVISNTLMQFRFNRHIISRLHEDLSLFKKIKNNPTPKVAHASVEEFLTDFTVKNINFSYKNSNIPVLNDISLEIIAGESIGFIGASGSGKTTLVDVLLGLLVPQKGGLFFNKKPIRESLIKWRSQVAYLPQEVFLIDDTLRHNVALGIESTKINDIKLIQSLKKARLSSVVEHLQDGINTSIGENGIRLSGGQRQRVALARAFYHERNVLIMDESTSNLDNETEQEIIGEIKHFKGDKTIIVIAHRLSTLAHCDRIYCLEQGHISKVGTPEEILGFT